MNPKGRTGVEGKYYDNPNPFADFDLTGKVLCFTKHELLIPDLSEEKLAWFNSTHALKRALTNLHLLQARVWFERAFSSTVT